uniref:ribosomal protein S3 n=1 Tax=Zygnema circumcarinatum TaxID=35869 RepID=UPI002411323A|nr:ribosomal protein S3 [Zygnema circumcarinatum]WEL36368.1 ribosomal protein S3 [Zygnema circumcarinatum]
MSQKVNPIAVRLKLNRKSDSSWFSDYYYATLLYQDCNFKNYLSSIRQPTGTKLGFRPGRCIMHHYPKRSVIHIFCLYFVMQYCFQMNSCLVHSTLQYIQPEEIQAKYLQLCLAKSRHYYLSNIQRVLSSQTKTLTSIIPMKVTSVYQSALLLAQEICCKLEQTKSFRQICKTIFKEIEMCSYIKGIRIACSGRFNGAEIAKTECKQYGETSLHVFSDQIDYAYTKASTPYGILGVKVWICYL